MELWSLATSETLLHVVKEPQSFLLDVVGCSIPYWCSEARCLVIILALPVDRGCTVDVPIGPSEELAEGVVSAPTGESDLVSEGFYALVSLSSGRR